LGSECFKKLASIKVIVFGVGGVGSWCVEALVRSGIHKLTIVDSDFVCVTNINRQLQATAVSVGKVKVDELARRLREINPDVEVCTLQRRYNRDTAAEFDLADYDYVIDAIDSLSSKVELIINAAAAGATLYSALGAAGKLDPARIRVSSIWDSNKCRLGRFVRKRLRRRGFKDDFICVWSDEPFFSINKKEFDAVSIDEEDESRTNDISVGSKQINGSIVHLTGIFGFMLSGLVIQDMEKKFGIRYVKSDVNYEQTCVLPQSLS
jgi:tRNA A37 threonylcarbamoyladenosine dehydratase